MLYFCFSSVDLYICRDEFYVSCSRCNISNSPGLIRVYFRIGGLPRFETNWGEKKNGICLHFESHSSKLSSFVDDCSDPHHSILVLDDSTGRRPAKKENLVEWSIILISFQRHFFEEFNVSFGEKWSQVCFVKYQHYESYSMIFWNWNKVNSYISALKPLPRLPNSPKRP